MIKQNFGLINGKMHSYEYVFLGDLDMKNADDSSLLITKSFLFSK